MSIERMDHPAVSLAAGCGVDLPGQAARGRTMWLAGRQGRSPLLLVALLWARECPDVVRQLELYLDALFADYRCTPAGWSEVQAARQVLAALNQQLYWRQRSGRRIAQLDAGLLLLQDGEAQFLQAGAIGLLRYQAGSLHCLAGREGLQLGQQAELALMQYSLPLKPGEVLLLAPQPLLAVADLQGFRSGCGTLAAEGLPALLAPLLGAPGAATVLLAGTPDVGPAPPAAREQWPALNEARVGMQVDGWTLLADCSFGPLGRLFRGRDESDREALLWFAEAAADDAFWQREWALRRSPVASLPQVLSAYRPRRHAFLLFEPPLAGTRSLADWAAAHGPLDGQILLDLLEQLIAAVRALQRRGMQGLWLSPRHILIDPGGRLLLLPEHAALLPGVPRQPLPSEAIPLAPEARGNEQPLDGRADQFALAALAYWLLCGQWPEIARPEGGSGSRYVPLANFGSHLPAGWDGVLARALAPRAVARFEALSEFQQALRQPLQQASQPPRLRTRPANWRLLVLGVLLLQLGLGLFLSLID